MNANDGVSVNVKYKDRLFRFIFGAKENKKYLLSLYNALNDSDYTDESALEITTLDDVIYIKMKNDVSFLFDSELNLYEHQSTYNPNMPLRGMMYFADLYRQYLSVRGRDLYGRTLERIPTPKYCVFYNGDKAVPDRSVLKLSDAFEKEDSTGMYEWSAIMLNINAGHNRELMEKCEALWHYAMYVSKVKTYSETMPIDQAVSRAVEEAIAEGYLDGFFKKHREGVVNVSLTEFNEAEFIENRRAEGREEGRAEGRAEGREEGRREGLEEGRREGHEDGRREGVVIGIEQVAVRLIRRGESDEDIVDVTGCSVERIRQLRDEQMALV